MLPGRLRHLNIPIGLKIVLDCVGDWEYFYGHKVVIFSAPKQAFDELRSGFEADTPASDRQGVTECCFKRAKSGN